MCCACVCVCALIFAIEVFFGLLLCPSFFCVHFHLLIVNGIRDVLHGETKLSRSHAIVLVGLRCLVPAASVLRDLATFYEHFTTRFLPLFMELLDRRGAILCSASAGL